MVNQPHAEVIVVMKTHLDIGFTDFSHKVLAQYMKDYIPSALALAKKTRSSENRFVWTTGSWLAYRFLTDADRKGRRMMEEAIEHGDFHWHSLPFTTHTELMEPELFQLGLEFSRRLDHRFGRKTIAAKMTDVPGHTLGMVPLLAEAGIRLLHLGVNPTSQVPDVPSLFRWRCGQNEVVVIYDKIYGATTALPGGICLSMNLTNDNLGPQNPEEIDKLYDSLRAEFPRARIRAGSMDEVAGKAWDIRHKLPLITSEIGDTWIHGVGTDPRKVARFRELNRLRAEWLHEGVLQQGGDDDLAFGEKLLLVAEHTWGMDIKTHLHDKRTWSPLQLQRALKKPNFCAVAESWQEQRAYLDQAMKALPTSLRSEAKKRLKRMERTAARLSAVQNFTAGEMFVLGKWEIALDSSGAISELKHGSRLFLKKGDTLAALVYQTFSNDDYQRFYRQYCRLDIDWALQDFTKPGMRRSPSLQHCPTLISLEASRKGECAKAVLSFPSSAQRIGAPLKVGLQIVALPDGLDLRLSWENKPANRLPEALWLRFQPHVDKADWRFEKMGFKMDPLNVVPGGNRHLHGVTGLITADNFSLRSLDAVLVAPGEPRLIDFSRDQPDLKKGISSVLYNNLWGTNFPMWYSDPACFRYELRWK